MLGALINDKTWSESRLPHSVQISFATFGILALELALIRWSSGQVRVFAYFNNLVLIGAFMGMGLGVALGKRFPGLIHLTLPTLLLVSIPFAFSEELGIMRLHFPDNSVFLWGSQELVAGISQYVYNLSVMLILFCLMVLVFVFAGSVVGFLFPRMPTLKAYTYDLLGSLLGVIAFTALTFFNTSPPVWFLLCAAPFLVLSRKPLTWISVIGVTILALYSVKGASFSPYNRIDLSKTIDGFELSINRDFHQYMLDLSDESVRNEIPIQGGFNRLAYLRGMYDLPFVINSRRQTALILGAGTGNDVQAALRAGYHTILSVDIDGVIIRKGMELHPEKPYDSDKVIPVVNDARAFLKQYDGEPLDVICYGLLDSHAMFSSMSTLRLDNYVYTVEGIRSAWEHVAPHGHMTISFSNVAGPWIIDRMYWTIAKATGKKPLVINHDPYGSTYIVAQDKAIISGSHFMQFDQIKEFSPIDKVDTPTDDWPFLYINPGVLPLGYFLIISLVLLIAVLATPLAFGRSSLRKNFDLGLFFMGAAFLLIETRGVTSLSLLFGSTWIVNSAIFSGILVMVLLANIFVQKVKPGTPLPWFGLLLFSSIMLYTVNVSSLNNLSMLTRGIIGGLINGLPIGFAGIIVSIFLARSNNPGASLGSNLLGSVVGGCIEYLSMYTGLRSLVLLAMVFYLAAVLKLMRDYYLQEK